MSLWTGFERSLSNSILLTFVELGHWSGFVLTKTLHFPRALGILKCNNDSVAFVYAASAMDFVAVRLTCLKALNDTTSGPWTRRTCSLTLSTVGWSIVLSHVALVISFKNYKIKNE